MRLPVLTPEEKRVVAFVLAAFVLGLGTKYYRDNHRQSPPPNETGQSGVRTQRTLPELAKTTPQEKKRRKVKALPRDAPATPTPGANGN